MYAEVKNGAVVTFPYDYDILVQKNPSTKFAQTDLLSMYSGTEANLDGHELVRVTEADAPTFNKQTQKVVQNSAPTLVGNVWTLNWSVESLTQTEQEAKNTSQAKSVRHTRDDKLKECDWVVIKNLETNSNIPGAWATYRQALRDVPTQAGFPWTITWPDAP
jgi:hypothetical protein